MKDKNEKEKGLSQKELEDFRSKIDKALNYVPNERERKTNMGTKREKKY